MRQIERPKNQDVSELYTKAFLLTCTEGLEIEPLRKEFRDIIREARQIFKDPDSVSIDSSRHAIRLAYFMHIDSALCETISGIKLNGRLKDSDTGKIFDLLEKIKNE